MADPQDLLVVDVGTSSVRAGRFAPDGTLTTVASVATPPEASADGSVTFSPEVLLTAALDAARAALEAGPVSGLGLAVQRASTVVWDRRTGASLGPGIGWQDLRTVGRCLELQAEGVRLAPNATATKAEWLLGRLDRTERDHALVGTIDAWLLWHLSEGDVHATDATNAGVTGLTDRHGSWDHAVLDVLAIEPASLPQIVDTAGRVAEASILPGAPPVLAVVGDQQASLVGQGCVTPDRAKLTLGTGGMLDRVGGTDRRSIEAAGCFPIVAWQQAGDPTPGVEAVLLAAGDHVAWLVDGLGLLDRVADAGLLASTVPDTGGVVFVPAIAGLGTPVWDHGARGALFGVTRGTSRAQVVRAVLEGVALRAADLVEATERATGVPVERLGLDGGMAADPTVAELVASATGRPVDVAGEVEATSRGAGLLAMVGAGHFVDVAATVELARPSRRVEPGAPLDRDRFAEAVERARRWHAPLSDLSF